jgi:uncharacterized membrane protein
MRTGPRVISERNGSSSPGTDLDEYSRAANAYLAWPLAVFELARRAPGSLWYRAHLQQAALLGGLLTASFFALLSVPLFLVLLLGGPALSSTATIRLYAVAMIADIVVLGISAFLIVGAALRASRGELFTIPLVTPLSRRLFVRRRG